MALTDKPKFTPVPQMVRALTRAGWTQGQIARAIGVTQGHISRLATDVFVDTTYALGKQIELLYTAKAKPPKPTHRLTEGMPTG